MSALEGRARAWLVEPKYVKVFKPTMDVVKDYLCTGLVVLASIVLAVNLALSLGSGPIVCFLTEGLIKIRIQLSLLYRSKVCLARTKL